jgi:tyrosyl-tRNA synthetase
MKKIVADTNTIDELLTRGVGDFIDPDGLFQKKLEQNPEKIVIKFGVDPTRPDIHLGHAVVLRKLRQFQDRGCKVIFLIGDYTTMIGDPTGKSKVRPEISQKEINTNMKSYLAQVGGILRTDSTVFSWIRNSDWFLGVTDIEPKQGLLVRYLTTLVNPNSFVGKAILFENTRMQRTELKRPVIHTVTLSRILGTLRHITHARLIERDMFQDRFKNNQELYMHEMMYPVLQGIDSTLLANIYGSCDMEVGGTDQTFNMLMGRDVMKMNKQEPQAVLSFKLLEGTDGKEKMSKSLDNYVGITDQPSDMYGKIMSIPDSSIVNYFELCTFTPLDEVERIAKKLSDPAINPKDLKMNLARQIVAIYHGEKEAEKAENNFTSTFSKKEIPDEMEKIVAIKDSPLIDAIVVSKIVESKNEFRRLLDAGAVTDLETGEKVTDPDAVVSKPMKLKIGKKRFVEIVY